MTVLSGTEIEDHLNDIFGDTGSSSNVRAARYLLTLGDRFIILPSGQRYFGEGHGSARCRRIVLEPGQTALLSTKERLVMPLHLAGLIGPRFDIADNGILFLGGPFVDPGFGLRWKDGAWKRRPEPLFFHIANVGACSRELRPLEEQIASLTFMKLGEPYQSTEDFPREYEALTTVRLRKEMFDPTQDGNPPPDRALGLVEDIKDIRQRVEKSEASTKQVVLFGVVVLAVSLFAAMVTLLSSDRANQIELSLAWWEALLVGLVIFLVPAGLVGMVFVWAELTAALRRRLSGRP